MIYSENIGEGTPIVLIHGFCETSSVWTSLKNKLALSHKVITIDLPGFGNSPLPTSDFSIMDIAEMVHGFLEDNNLLKSVIIGHSLGGYVTLAMMERYPDDFFGVGLFHSSAMADDDEKKTGRNKTIEFVKKRGVKVFADSFVPQLFYVKNRQKLAKEITEVTKTAAGTNQDSMIKYMEAMRDRPARTEVLRSYKNPVLFIAGDQDTSVPIEKSRAQYNMMQQSTVIELKDVGHMGMFEAKEHSFIAISQFLSQFDSQTDSNTPGVLPDRDLKKNLGCG